MASAIWVFLNYVSVWHSYDCLPKSESWSAYSLTSSPFMVWSISKTSSSGPPSLSLAAISARTSFGCFLATVGCNLTLTAYDETKRQQKTKAKVFICIILLSKFCIIIFNSLSHLYKKTNIGTDFLVTILL